MPFWSKVGDEFKPVLRIYMGSLFDLLRMLRRTLTFRMNFLILSVNNLYIDTCAYKSYLRAYHCDVMLLGVFTYTFIHLF